MTEKEYYELCNLVRNRIRNGLSSQVRGNVTTYVFNESDQLSIRIIDEKHSFNFDYIIDNFTKEISSNYKFVEESISKVLRSYKYCIVKAFFKEV